MIARLKNIIFNKGFVFTFLLSMFCLCFFYGKLLRHPNQIYFSANGDGLQSYYVALYHVKYDVSYWHLDGLNYPYGEQVFFTGCQPFVTNTIKLVSNIIDISNYTVGILNLIMLLSIVVSALSLYLIFKHFKLPNFYSGIAGTAIAFLSPQIIRLGGHFSLTYQFAIPLFILLLLKFYKAPTVKKSILIGILTFFMAGTHFYFFGFFAILSFFYWLILYFSDEQIFSKTKFATKHIFIQLLSPFLLLQGIIFFIDNVKDRTNFPWGYMTYISNWTGVLYPTNKFYTPVFEKLFTPAFPEWEGYAFIGVVAVIIFIGMILLAIRNVLNREFVKVFQITNDKILNTFFWGSFFALLLAFGYPFSIKGCEDWLSNSGPLKQLRGIGRLTWLFYYVINIIAFYKLYQWASLKSHLAKQFWLGIILFFVCYDAYIMSIDKQPNLNNSVEQLNDTQNLLEENKWINEIKTDNFQAIITLPYFHVGSENVWISPESEIIKDVFITSIKTGLPTTSLILSRVSLSQTYNNIQIVKGPYRPLDIVKDFKNEKPFLVLVRENELNKEEKFLLSKCKKIKEAKNFNIYELTTETLKHISDYLYAETQDELKNTKTFLVDGLQSSDSIKTFVYKNYEDQPNTNSFLGNGCLEGKIKDYNVLFKGTIPNMKEGDYVVSFWMGDFRTDVYPRSTVELAFTDSTGAVYGTSYFNPGKNMSVMDGNWALIESNFRLKNKTDQLIVTIWNQDITSDKKRIHLDELLIRPTETRIFKNISAEHITLNNRTYLAK